MLSSGLREFLVVRIYRIRSALDCGEHRVQRGTAEVAAIRHHCANPSCVAYVDERIRVEEHEISEFSCRDAAERISCAEELRRAKARRAERLQRSQTDVANE